MITRDSFDPRSMRVEKGLEFFRSRPLDNKLIIDFAVWANSQRWFKPYHSGLYLNPDEEFGEISLAALNLSKLREAYLEAKTSGNKPEWLSTLPKDVALSLEQDCAVQTGRLVIPKLHHTGFGYTIFGQRVSYKNP